MYSEMSPLIDLKVFPLHQLFIGKMIAEGETNKTYNIIPLQVLPINRNGGALDDEIVLELLVIFVFSPLFP